MSPGAVVAISAWSAFVAGVVYGLSHDVRHWLANRRQPADAVQRHPVADSAWPDAPTQPQEREWLEDLEEHTTDLVREYGRFAPAMVWIEHLPTASGRND